MRNESIIILCWKYTQKNEGWYPLLWFSLIESDVSSLVNDCLEALPCLRWDTTVALSWFHPFNLQNRRWNFIEICVTSSFHVVDAIHWSVVCSVDRLQRVCKPLAKCTPPHMQNTVVCKLVFVSWCCTAARYVRRDYIIYWGDWVCASFSTFSPHKITRRRGSFQIF